MKRRKAKRATTPQPPKESQSAFLRRVLLNAKASLATSDFDAARAALSAPSADAAPK